LGLLLLLKERRLVYLRSWNGKTLTFFILQEIRSKKNAGYSSKRDRDETTDSRYQYENSFGEDGGYGDPALKKPRRRNPNKGKRGGRRGGLP